jgi:hypothetical protein
VCGGGGVLIILTLLQLTVAYRALPLRPHDGGGIPMEPDLWDVPCYRYFMLLAQGIPCLIQQLNPSKMEQRIFKKCNGLSSVLSLLKEMVSCCSF